jgi:hypothetical protein
MGLQQLLFKTLNLGLALSVLNSLRLNPFTLENDGRFTFDLLLPQHEEFIVLLLNFLALHLLQCF